MKYDEINEFLLKLEQKDSPLEAKISRLISKVQYPVSNPVAELNLLRQGLHEPGLHLYILDDDLNGMAIELFYKLHSEPSYLEKTSLHPDRGNVGTALGWACQLGSRDIVNFLLKQGAKVKDEKSLGGFEVSPVVSALRGNHPAILDKLIEVEYKAFPSSLTEYLYCFKETLKYGALHAFYSLIAKAVRWGNKDLLMATAVLLYALGVKELLPLMGNLNENDVFKQLVQSRVFLNDYLLQWCALDFIEDLLQKMNIETFYSEGILTILKIAVTRSDVSLTQTVVAILKKRDIQLDEKEQDKIIKTAVDCKNFNVFEYLAEKFSISKAKFLSYIRHFSLDNPLIFNYLKKHGMLQEHGYFFLAMAIRYGAAHFVDSYLKDKELPPIQDFYYKERFYNYRNIFHFLMQKKPINIKIFNLIAEHFPEGLNQEDKDQGMPISKVLRWHLHLDELSSYFILLNKLPSSGAKFSLFLSLCLFAGQRYFKFPIPIEQRPSIFISLNCLGRKFSWYMSTYLALKYQPILLGKIGYNDQINIIEEYITSKGIEYSIFLMIQDLEKKQNFHNNLTPEWKKFIEDELVIPDLKMLATELVKLSIYFMALVNKTPLTPEFIAEQEEKIFSRIYLEFKSLTNWTWPSNHQMVRKARNICHDWNILLHPREAKRHAITPRIFESKYYFIQDDKKPNTKSLETTSHDAQTGRGSSPG